MREFFPVVAVLVILSLWLQTTLVCVLAFILGLVVLFAARNHYDKDWTKWPLILVLASIVVFLTPAAITVLMNVLPSILQQVFQGGAQ